MVLLLGFDKRRYELLATRLGLADGDHARGKMARLWRQCTLEQTHVLTADDVVVVLGPKGPEALVAARLGEWLFPADASGNPAEASETQRLVRIRGTKGRIEWLGELRGGASEGGKARAATAARDSRGRLLPSGLQPGLAEFAGIAPWPEPPVSVVPND